MNPINFLKAFFELGMVVWWIIGSILLILGFALAYSGMQSLDFIEASIGFIIVLIGAIAVYYGTKIKNIKL